MQIIVIVGALAAASIPIAIGWRRTASEAEMARQMGLALPEKRFSPEKFAQQTGTGLSFNQIAYGFLVWGGGGLMAGLVLGALPAVMFSLAGGLLYAGSLTERRQAFRMTQAKDILRGLGVVETLIGQGRPLTDSLEEAANAVGPDGQIVLADLVHRLRTAPADQAGEAIRGWTRGWDNPAVDVVGTTLLASVEGRIEITPLVKSLRGTLSEIVEVLSRARAAAKGIEWQARFLALFPPVVLVVMALTTPEAGTTYARNPLYIVPVLVGSGTSYILSTLMIRNGLSIESSMGLHAGRYEIRMDRLGKVL